MKNFCSTKDTIKKIKSQTMDREKILTTHKSVRGFVTWLYIVFLKHKRKTTKPIWKADETLEWPREDTQMTNGHLIALHH